MRLAFVFLLSSICACRPSVEHDGYPPALRKPWTQPQLVTWSNGGEATGRISYAERRRARWFVVDLDGGAEELRVRVRVHNRRQRFGPVQLEVLTERGHVLARASGSGTRRRVSLSRLRSGRYLIHVYTNDRERPSNFRLRVRRRGLWSSDPPGPPKWCIWSKAAKSTPQSSSGRTGRARNPGYAPLPCVRQPAALP